MNEVAAAPKSDSQVISAGMVRIYKERLGRGPTKVRTFINDDMVVTILSDSLTKVEETLAETKSPETVRHIRRSLQAAMEDDMRALVEKTLHRQVMCFLSDHSPDPDYAAELLLLAPSAAEVKSGRPGVSHEDAPSRQEPTEEGPQPALISAN